MRGYRNIRECIEDLKLLVTARELDPQRSAGETVTAYLLKKIGDGSKHCTKSYMREMNKNHYTPFDVELIALHDYFGHIHDIDYFLQSLNRNLPKSRLYRKIMRSSAFRSGRLQALYRLLPRQMQSRDDLVDFVKSRGYVSHADLALICSIHAGPRWKAWLSEAIKAKEIFPMRGGWR